MRDLIFLVLIYGVPLEIDGSFKITQPDWDDKIKFNNQSYPMAEFNNVNDYIMMRCKEQQVKLMVRSR